MVQKNPKSKKIPSEVLDNISLYVSGAAPFPPEAIKDFEKQFHTENKFVEVYGMTETAVLATVNPMYGKKHSLETRLKMSQNLPDLSGSNNGRWNSTLTEEDRLKRRITPEYLTWRNSVFERDDYTCVYCGVRGGNMEAHHLESYARNPEVRFDVNNGVTMCIKHHKKFHKKYGCINNTIKQFISFMGGKKYGFILR